MKMGLEGRVALVTGAARDVGREIAIALAAEGAAVAVNYNTNPEKADEVVPDLARSWRRDRSGMGWTFSLAPEGNLDAETIQRQLTGASSVWDGLASARAIGRGALRVELVHPTEALPGVLADPALTLAIGSSPPSQFVRQVAGPPDLRDVLDPSAPIQIDLLFTRDLGVVAYARTRPGWLVAALPFDRRYALASTRAAPNGTRPGADLVDAVAVDARPPDEPSRGAAPCPAPGRNQVAVVARPAVVYLAADPTAKALAGRIVALAARPDPPAWLASRLGSAGVRISAVAADSTEFRAAIATGSALLAIVSEPARPSLACSALAGVGGSPLPLLETRAYLVVRRGTGPLAIDRSGTVRWLGSGPR